MRFLQMIAVILGLLIVGAIVYQSMNRVAPQLTPEQMQMQIVAARNTHLRWQVFWWMVTAGLSLAALGGGYYIVALAKNSRERIYADPVTGLWPITREDRAPWWERLRGNHDWIEEDPNLAIAPTRRIHANGKLTVQADLHGASFDQQIEYAAKSWTVQRAIAATGGGIRPNAAMLKDAAGVFDAEARRKNLLADLTQRRVLPEISSAIDGEYRVMQVSFPDALQQSTKTEFVLGQSASGEIIRWNVEQAPHIRVHGKTQGSGKTNLIKQIALCAVRAGHHVIVLDRRMFKDWQPFRRHVELVDNRKPGAFMATVAAVRDIYQQRDVQLGAAGADNIESLGIGMQRIFVVISEFGSAIRELADEQKVVIVSALKTIISEAGATGVHLVMEDQTNSKWPREIRGNAEPITGYLPEDTASAGGYKKAYELEPYEFHHDGEHFRTWDMKAEAPRLLMSIPADDDVMVDTTKIDAPVHRSPVHSVENNNFSPEIDGKNNFPVNGERLNGVNAIEDKGPTDLQQQVWEWRDANPNGTQAELRAHFDSLGVQISRGHVFNCWHAWPGAPREKPQPQTVAEQLQALGYDPADIRLPGGDKIGVDVTTERR